MGEYVVTCCSTVDLEKELLEKRKINYACCSFECNGKTYLDDYGISYPIDKFYEDIKNGMEAKTSQVNMESYMELFEPYLKEGKDVLHITMSSGISGTINSAYSAAKELSAKYQNKVYVVDSLCCSSGYGMLVNIALDNKESGMSLQDNLDYIQKNRYSIIHWFFSSDLSGYVRGGRLSKAAGFVGSALQLCPVMCVSDEGRLEIFEKVRTKKKASKTIVDNMLNEVGPLYDGPCYISNSACLEDANYLKELLEEAFVNLKDIRIYNIGSAIGSHTGPGTVALFYVGKKRAV